MVKPNTLKLMKTAKQIKINNQTYTVTECSVCGATTRIKASLDTKTARKAIEHPCGTCNPIHNPLQGKGWWLAFKLDENPYVYGPMPRLRTSKTHRMEEARRNGWMAWVWCDEYKEERRGLEASNRLH
jgi:hypothetical protein